ncbi:hypothetical protein P9869_41815 [Streptomyces ossamyceticus]|nr:hypothetical protein [Streptomyces ossamyceticus]
MNIEPLLDALGLQEDAARALADDLRTKTEELHGRLQEAQTHLEHLAITRKTVTALADRLPAAPPDLPEHPDYPRIVAAFNEATSPLRARDVCEALDHELLPKNRSPLLVRQIVGRNGGVISVPEAAPKDVRPSNVHWLTPRTWRKWVIVGLRGHTRGGVPQPGWVGGWRTGTWPPYGC